jgi:uncharacterized FlaG/YvyC family protein
MNCPENTQGDYDMNLESTVEAGWGVRKSEPPEPVAALSARPKWSKAYGAAENKAVAPNREALNGFAGAVEKFAASLGISLKLNVHEPTGTIQAEVRDGAGEKVLREIPPDDILDLAVSIRKLSGLFAERAL